MISTRDFGVKMVFSPEIFSVSADLRSVGLQSFVHRSQVKFQTSYNG